MPRRIDREPTLPNRPTVGLLLLVAALGACELPDYAGPQLQDPPRGFVLQPGSYAEHSMFAHLPSIYHDAWVESLPPFSSIRINGYAGVLTLEDVLSAQDSGRAHVFDPEITFSPVEPMTIDGRDAWGWEERIDTPTRGIPWVAYRVMVPYDTISYTIEFSTENSLYKGQAPESMKAVVGTFAVGEVVYNLPLIAVAAGLLLFAVHLARQKSRAKAARLRSINLVKIEKKEEEDDPRTGAMHVPPGERRTPPGRPSAE